MPRERTAQTGCLRRRSIERQAHRRRQTVQMHISKLRSEYRGSLSRSHMLECVISHSTATENSASAKRSIADFDLSQVSSACEPRLMPTGTESSWGLHVARGQWPTRTVLTPHRPALTAPSRRRPVAWGVIRARLSSMLAFRRAESDRAPSAKRSLPERAADAEAQDEIAVVRRIPRPCC